MKKSFTFFAVTANRDTTEGRGPSFFTGIGFNKKGDAVAFAKSDLYARKWGVMGCPGSAYDVEEMTITIFDDFAICINEINDHFKAEAKAAALRTLTDEERKLLGL